MRIQFCGNRRLFAFVYVLCMLPQTVLPAASTLTARQLYEQGQQAQRAGDWFSAVEAYQEAVQLNSVYGDAWYALAECSYALGEYSLALSYLDTAARFALDRTDILNLTGFCYLGLNDTVAADTIFRQVLATYPNNVEARFGLAQLDILAGRLTGAQNMYLDALKRQQSNRNALLSVALVAQELGKTADAQAYIDQALRYHGSDAEVQYVAAWIAFLNGNFKETESHVRTSVNLNPALDKSYELLATVLYQQEQWQDAVDVCDYRLTQNRNNATAWYLKGRALQQMGQIEEAYRIFEAGLAVVPQDEIMRTTLELLVLEYFDIEDIRRSKWAEYHIERAVNHEKLYESAQAEFEYKNALRLDPLNVKARTGYAAMLDSKGQQELYLEQLTFISSIEPVSVRVADTIEAYKSLLSDTLAVRWNVEPFYVDKTRWHIGLFSTGNDIQLLHADAGAVTVQAVASQLSGSAIVDAQMFPESVSYAEAFRIARSAGQDYFILMEFEENDRELLLSTAVYSGRTGSEVTSFRFYRTGNDRYTGALRRFCSSIVQMLPVKGRVIARNADTVLVDLGTSDGIVVGTELDVIKSGVLSTPDMEIGIVYSAKDVLGKITITEVSETVSQGKYDRNGFYDRMNLNDEVVPVPVTDTDGTVAETDTAATQVSIVPSAEDISGTEYPVLSRMLQELYLIQ